MAELTGLPGAGHHRHGAGQRRGAQRALRRASWAPRRRRCGTRWPATTRPPTAGSGCTRTTPSTGAPRWPCSACRPSATPWPAAVRTWPAERAGDGEVVAAGGCAAALHTARRVARPRARPPRRRAAPGGDRAARRRARRRPCGRERRRAPLAGLRVLDLTRVIAGPVATRFLAAWGADVLRVEAPAFDELELLFIEVGFGKRSCGLDLRADADRAAFEALVAGADVLVHGYRPGALRGLGYAAEALAALRPGLVVAGAVGLRRRPARGPSAGASTAWCRCRPASPPRAPPPPAPTGRCRCPASCSTTPPATCWPSARVRALQRRRRRGRLVGGRRCRWPARRRGSTASGADEAASPVPSPTGRDVERWCQVSPTPWGDVHHVGPPGRHRRRRGPRWHRPPSRPGTDPPVLVRDRVSRGSGRRPRRRTSAS